MMDIMGLHLGLKPPDYQGGSLASRVCAPSVYAEAKSLPADAVYIGQGHFSHRWKPGKWSSPFQAGRDCAGAVHVIKYAQWVANQPELLQSLHELQGKRLVCDCPHNVLCHGDVLVCLAWHSSSLLSAGKGHGRQPSSLSARTVAMFAAGAKGCLSSSHSYHTRMRSCCFHFTLSWGGLCGFSMAYDRGSALGQEHPMVHRMVPTTRPHLCLRKKSSHPPGRTPRKS